MTQLPLGKKPPTYDRRDLQLAHYLEKDLTDLPPVPRNFGHARLYTDWGMLGNDQYGDCVFAGADHETMLWNKLANHPVTFTADDALSDYGAVTGFTPADPNTDQGTYVRDALKYRRKTGLRDAVSNRHLIGAYAAIELGNFDQLLEAVYLFDAVGIGFEFPASAMDQFNAGKPWSVVAGSPVEGGHYVPVVGRPALSMLSVITWGRRQYMTRAFYEKYCDEAWALLSLESLNTKGVNDRGLNLATLQADLLAL